MTLGRPETQFPQCEERGEEQCDAAQQQVERQGLPALARLSEESHEDEPRKNFHVLRIDRASPLPDGSNGPTCAVNGHAT